MNTCPRAWALTYGLPRRSAFERRQNWDTRPRDLDELVLRAMRQAWLENISDMYQRKIWTKAYTSKVVSRRVHDALAEHNMDAPMLLRHQKSSGPCSNCDNLVPCMPSDQSPVVSRKDGRF